VRRLLEAIERALPEPFTPTWVLSNHDRPRVMHRLGDRVDKARLLATLQLTARGVPFIYYGDELGMGHAELARAQAKDPVAARFRFVPRWLARQLLRHGILLNRDECRTPMQWHDGANAGFSPAGVTPWLPLHPRHREVNVAVAERDPSSLLRCYQRLLRLRRERPALHAGRLELVARDALPRDVVGYRRWHDGDEAHVYLNFSCRPTRLDLRRHRGRALFSALRDGLAPAPPEHTILPYEGIVIIDSGDVTARREP
jgi:glycosidase